MAKGNVNVAASWSCAAGDNRLTDNGPNGDATGIGATLSTYRPVSLLWHPRQDADPAHRWLRHCVRNACADQIGGGIISKVSVDLG